MAVTPANQMLYIFFTAMEEEVLEAFINQLMEVTLYTSIRHAKYFKLEVDGSGEDGQGTYDLALAVSPLIEI